MSGSILKIGAQERRQRAFLAARSSGRDFMAKRTVRSGTTANGEGRQVGGLLPDEEPVPPPVRPSRRSDSADAFFPDPQEGGPSRAPDDLAETLAEDFVASATSGDNVDDEVMN